MLVSGPNEQVDLVGGTILGGKLQTTKNAFVLATTGNNAISGTTIVSGSVVQAVGGTLTATNVTIGSNTELAAFNGAVLTVSGGVIGKGDAVGAAGGGTAQCRSVVNSAFIEVFAPGLVVLGGSVNNAKGNILASGSGAVVALSGRPFPAASGRRRAAASSKRRAAATT